MTGTPAIRPTGQERTFGTDELIVSKTDPGGRISYANGLFLRLSAYPRADVIGKPHNIIRHPRMPRGIYRYLWDSIQADREVFAYIDNLAADGAHYWVLAHVTPSHDEQGRIIGYHSNRRHPDRESVEKVTGLYDRMLEVEARHSSGKAAAAAGLAYLNDYLSELDTTYDRYVWGIIREETRHLAA